MARHFVSCDRGQLLLMPPSLVEWLPDNHLVWTILGAVDQMDLDRFCEEYRLGGAGRPAYDPAMLALLLYAYARGLLLSDGWVRRTGAVASDLLRPRVSETGKTVAGGCVDGFCVAGV